MEKATEPRLSIRDVSKRFRIGTRGGESALARVVATLSGRQPTRPLAALHGVSLELAPGEIVGVIGRNGSGKSTLLRLAAGIYEPDAGEIVARGRVLYVSGFGHSARPRLTVRESVHLGGATMGLSRAEVAALLGEIVAFAGLAEFEGAKLSQLSSGMVSRLNFSTFAHCALRLAPDVLLLDEVVGPGGDAEFRARAAGKLREILAGGAAALLVSHSLGELEGTCGRAVWLDGGRVCGDGDFAQVSRDYLAAVGRSATISGQ